ncbi:glycosyltransferase family 4 protein [Flavobacterium davisii]|nr:glycosyltransferase family 4 protein [Flavobacterium davisii]
MQLSWNILVALFFLFLVRPYVGVIVLLSLVFVLFEKYKNIINKKFWIPIVLLSFFGVVFFMTQFVKLESLSIESILLKFEGYQNYVEKYTDSNYLADLGYIGRVLMLLCLPLFYKVENFFQFISSIENLMLLLVVIYFFFKKFYNHTRNWFELDTKFALYTSISIFLFLSTYIYNLGLASRMRLMFYPLFFYVMAQSLKKDKLNEKKKIVRITTVPISLEKLLTGQLTYMSQFYEVIAISSEKENLVKFGKSNQLPVFYLNLTRKITPFYDLYAIFRLVVFLIKTKPEIVHTHTPKAGMVGMIASKLAGVPHRLHTVAGLPLMEAVGVKRKILNLVEKITYVCATKVYPNSKGLEEFILENNFAPKEKIKIIGNGSSNGINTAFFAPEQISKEETLKLKAQLDIAKDDFVFIFVGRLVKDKGINELITAFTNLNLSKTKLLLVGPLESDLDPLLPETLTEIEENINIINVGYQSDVRPYFKVANLLVFPSYREGFPNVVMQAGAMGLPAIVSNINGCNEIIEEEKNGLIIPVKNSKAIEEAMRKVYQEKSLFDQLKSNARQMIVSRYEQKIIWEAIRNEYENLEHV